MSKIIRICDEMDRYYGSKIWATRLPILDELVLTVLSQNTTAKNCRQAYARLRERFPTWEDVRLARVDDIAEAIAVAGLANQRAPRIQAILNEVKAQQGNLDLEWLAEKPDQEALDYLLRFKGVGRKTAAFVLMFALDRPVLPVDTHIHRIAMRLGLIGEVDADKAHDLLQEMVPPERIYSFHINMVAHGREVCHAHQPRCEICVLREDCDYFACKTETGR